MDRLLCWTSRSVAGASMPPGEVSQPICALNFLLRVECVPAGTGLLPHYTNATCQELACSSEKAHKEQGFGICWAGISSVLKSFHFGRSVVLGAWLMSSDVHFPLPALSLVQGSGGSCWALTSCQHSMPWASAAWSTAASRQYMAVLSCDSSLVSPCHVAQLSWWPSPM